MNDKPEDATPQPDVAVGDLQGAADRIAASASSVADALTAGVPRTPAQRILRRIAPLVLYMSGFLGGAFALEQYLASQYQASLDRVEAQLTAATEALGSRDHIAQAQAVRSLARISEFSTYEAPPGFGSLGRHLLAGLAVVTLHYPYFDQSWMVLRDFASSRAGASHSLVSSEILREGAAWAQRIRRGRGVPAGWNRGSLLFAARMSGAIGNDLDLSHIQFGAADLSQADLSGSDCTACGLLGAKLAGSILRAVKLDSAYLAEADVARANLSFARLGNAVLTNTDLRNAVLLQADLTGTRFNGARLDGATLSQAVLTHTDFRGASLRGTRFVQTNVSAAVFDSADVDGADFSRSLGFSPLLLRGALHAERALIPPSKGVPR